MKTDNRDWRDDFGKFVASLESRLESGERQYEGKSFDRSSAELMQELEQEILDWAGWGFILWRTLRRRIDHDGAAAE